MRSGRTGEHMSGAVSVADREDVDRRDGIGGLRGSRRSGSRVPLGRAHLIVRGLARVRAVPARRVPKRTWATRYTRGLVLSDLLAGCFAAAAAFVLRMPDTTSAATVTAAKFGPWAVAFPFFWIGATWLMNAFDERVVGLGAEEFHRCVRAFVALLAAVALVSYGLKAAVPRGMVVIAMPVVLVCTILGRYAARKALHRARAKGRASNRVVLVGDAVSVADLSERLQREAYAGMRVVGACVPTGELSDERAHGALVRVGVPILGDLDDVVGAVGRSDADTVAVTASHAFGPQRLRELSWQMERIDADMVVAPGLVEVAGPRLHIRPVTGLPLLHVEKPEFAGGKRVLKAITDRLAAMLLILVLSPIFIGTWLAVRLTSPGSGFFRQTRVGKDGKEFRIWKFRSMYADAEARLAALGERSDGNGMLFKMKNDPRVTRVGSFIRRYSIDELPQLFNVVAGSMSLVGPRPQLPSEVAYLGDDVRRRLLVKPGLTGLWQVSGRSDLSWEETVRLDLRYVENWSLGQDALILWKTASAVLRGDGAY
jgi:exopolysaccharide biosynthesis polyprenyl glycosylphosphotransferase